MKAWLATKPGAPRDVLRLDDVDAPEPGANEVLIRVEAVTLNFNDIDGIHGRYATVRTPFPYVPGMEVLGRVVGTGDGASTWRDRRVVAIPSGAYGGYAELVVAPTAMTFAMPDSLPLPDAAAIYMPLHLAWLALRERARVQPGETLLVHAAAGGAGSAALQLGVHAGARVIAVAGGAEKNAFCRELGAHVTIDHRETDFVAAVLDETGGRGVDVAFDTIGGDITVQTFRCMAFNGRHVLAGFASGIEHEDEGVVPRPVLFGNFSLVGVCHAYADDALEFRKLTGLNFPSHAQGEETHRQILGLVEQGAVRPVVGRELPFTELPDGLDAMERRATIGRVVVRL
ncbi:MAG TPA: NADPH:quinone oxidoreductase family protein [Acidimicrobiia bacterium]|nr:NADPH:quinone oxidoreductase family protein [Acidimicrobiia bacterium]